MTAAQGRDRSLAWRIFPNLLFLLVFAGTTWFFAAEIEANWASLRGAGIRLHAGWLLAALSMVIASYALVAAAWRRGINACHPGARTGMGMSMAIVNLTQLTKYLPGKVWSYAFQMLLMERQGVPKSAVVYVNVLVMLSMLSLSGLAGSLYLLLYVPRIPLIASLAGFCITAAAYAGMLFLNGSMMRIAARALARLSGVQIGSFELPVPVLLRMQVPLVIGNALFGLAACAVWAGIGRPLSPGDVFPLTAATLLADLLGFVVVVAPGGLGIREGALFVLLGGIADRNTALLFPLAMRAVTLPADLLLGGSALVLLRHLLQSGDRRTG